MESLLGIIAACFGLALLVLVVILLSYRARRASKDSGAIMRGSMMFDAYMYRERMNRILAERAIAPAERTDFDDVVAVARYIGEEVGRRANLPKSAADLNDDQLWLTMLFTMTAADHLSRMAGVSFEKASATACLTLFRPADESESLRLGTLFRHVIDDRNRMAIDPKRAKSIDAIGNQVALFFASGSEMYLVAMGELFQLLLGSIKSS